MSYEKPMVTIFVAQSQRIVFHRSLLLLKQHMPVTTTSAVIVQLVLHADAESMCAPSILSEGREDRTAGARASLPTNDIDTDGGKKTIPVSIPPKHKEAFTAVLEHLQQRWPSSSISALIVNLVINTAALLNDESSATLHTTGASPPHPTRTDVHNAGASSSMRNGLQPVLPAGITPYSLDDWVRRLLEPTQWGSNTLLKLWHIYAHGDAYGLYPVAQHMAEYSRAKPSSLPEHADWHSNVFQFAASVLVECGALEDAWAVADQAVTLARISDDRTYPNSGSRLGAALYHRARIAAAMSQYASGMSTRQIYLEKAYADGTEALACVSEAAACPYRAALHACLADVLAMLNGYSPDLAAHFDQALALAPNQPGIAVAGVSPSVWMIRYQRARTTLHLHDQQQAQLEGDFSLEGAARDVHEAIRCLPVNEVWWYQKLLIIQLVLARARDRPDEASHVTDELAFWLTCD